MAIAGRADALFPFDGVLDAIEQAKRRYRELSAEDRLQLHFFEVGHGFPSHVREIAYQWLDQWLGED